MLGTALGFASPLVLIALAALPAIWFLLRVTPPQPQRIAFPPLRLFADLVPQRETPARTPWWLLLLRLLIAALVILAAAGPVWNPFAEAPGAARGPLLLLVDNGFTAAHDWRERLTLAQDRIAAAVRAKRPVAIVPTADRPADVTLLDGAAAEQRMRAVAPVPWAGDRAAHLPALQRFLESHAEAEVEWLSDGAALRGTPAFTTELAKLVQDRPLTVYAEPAAPALAVAGLENLAGGLDVRLVRAAPNGRDTGTVRALDLKGLPLGDTRFSFGSGETETKARFDLPIEVRNSVARVEIADERSAGAVALVDESTRRRRVGLVTGATSDVAQPLLAPTYYVARALAPFADVREPKSGTSEAVGALLDENVSVLVLADVGALDRTITTRLEDFIESGGVLVRFAGSRLAAGGNDALVPVRLRRGGRSLGGSLSWDAPKTLAPFPRESPFFGLATPSEITVRRQILAEPDGDLAGRTWASLADGTPIVTAERRGNGLVVLFHVTADPAWSNLPLSGVFVDMLRRIVLLAGKAGDGGETAGGQAETVSPNRTLDGFGAFHAPPSTAKPIPRNYAGRGSEDHPPGFYGPNEALVAVNALTPDDALAPLDLTPLGARIEGIERPAARDLRAPLLTAALILLALDTLASMLLAGVAGRLRGRFGRTRTGSATAAVAVALALPALAALAALLAVPSGAFAQTPPQPPRQQQRPPLTKSEIEAALSTRLAYVVTGDAQVDATSRAGLTGLSQALAQRTALEAGDPVGVDPGKDELAFYPLLYWPVVAGRPLPPDTALRRLDAFMKGGGTVIFDTRDAISARPDGGATPEAQQLRRMLATLDIPELEPVPRDHVLTKAFYLLDTFPGRYGSGQTWVEAIPTAPDGERAPARAGDGVTPILITSNDLAAAWAVGRRGEWLYPVNGGDGRQREMAIRGGVNIVIYALTGNYKADQVHVPALLERLGQ